MREEENMRGRKREEGEKMRSDLPFHSGRHGAISFSSCFAEIIGIF